MPRFSELVQGEYPYGLAARAVIERSKAETPGRSIFKINGFQECGSDDYLYCDES